MRTHLLGVLESEVIYNPPVWLADARHPGSRVKINSISDIAWCVMECRYTNGHLGRPSGHFICEPLEHEEKGKVRPMKEMPPAWSTNTTHWCIISRWDGSHRVIHLRYPLLVSCLHFLHIKIIPCGATQSWLWSHLLHLTSCQRCYRCTSVYSSNLNCIVYTSPFETVIMLTL